MEFASPDLEFPKTFCCNCGDTNCETQEQHTRTTRYFGIYRSHTIFRLPLPVCATCRKTLRRPPSVFFVRVGVLALFIAGWYGALSLLGTAVQLPQWLSGQLLSISAALGCISTFFFYRLRSPKPPRTSFYQPVRIRQASVQFVGVMGGPGAVVFMKLAFTNPDYLNAFVNANQDAIKAGHLAVVKA